MTTGFYLIRAIGRLERERADTLVEQAEARAQV